MGRGGLRTKKPPPPRGRLPPKSGSRSQARVDALIREGLTRATRLADDAVGGPVNGELWAKPRRTGSDKLWAPYDPANTRVVSARDARRALRSVGVHLTPEGHLLASEEAAHRRLHLDRLFFHLP